MPVRRVALLFIGWLAVEAVLGFAEAGVSWHPALTRSSTVFGICALLSLVIAWKTPRVNMAAVGPPPPGSTIDPVTCSAIRMLTRTWFVLPMLIVGVFIPLYGAGGAGVAIGFCGAWLATLVGYLRLERKHRCRFWLTAPRAVPTRKKGVLYRTEDDHALSLPGSAAR